MCNCDYRPNRQGIWRETKCDPCTARPKALTALALMERGDEAADRHVLEILNQLKRVGQREQDGAVLAMARLVAGVWALRQLPEYGTCAACAGCLNAVMAFLTEHDMRLRSEPGPCAVCRANVEGELAEVLAHVHHGPTGARWRA